MTRIYVLVEGQTEETFVSEILAPHYRQSGRYLTPIVVTTSPGHKGGVTRYGKVKPQIDRLCKQDAAAWVTTMFDLYALPADFPGKTDPAYKQFSNGADKADYLENRLSADIGRPRFVANLIVHEFEALLFSDIAPFATWTDDDTVLKPLRDLSASTPPEEINDSPSTAPSKRILAAVPGYQKTFHGPVIASDIGLPTIRQKCPHFSSWLDKLEGLA
ncbi:DUF4276 family protein [Allorhizobium taibaishanense]|uniref:DUF4276 family protein n=1 Tax=Allorhizobium taibaishanense TaxID=887144 RepID=A0A1Q8ZZP5_9HYPH|nr:DUF4276 family protein [Allorhizobium taibaishanense]MBB4007220.1 hypothetical protein [Allorhizobium taibaishanense]OLP47771.1 hypothetical protein BJF91_05250 [Allorhizobium taibaishanense]